jgi:putative hydrolase of the HAD superfamily
LDEFQVEEPAETEAGGAIPILDPLPKAVLFDVYGTLVCPVVGDLADQTKLVSGEESFVSTAARFGFSPEVGKKWHEWFFEAIIEEHKEFKDKGIAPAEVQVDHIWARMILRVGGDPAKLDTRSVAAYREMLANPVRAFSGAAEALTNFKKNGIRLGIVSNSQFYTMPILGRCLDLDVTEIFEPDLTFQSFRLGFAKPSPHFFRLVKTALLHEGIEPEEALVVGNDLENDILSSQAHGLQALLFHGNDQSVRIGKGGHGGPEVRNYQRLISACGL